jgi:hypothetical protein
LAEHPQPDSSDLSSLALHCHTMRHRVFTIISLLIVALATGRREPLSPNPVRARHTDRDAGAAVQGGTRRTEASELVDAATGELRYRMIGPHRGGRTKAAAGIADQPNLFYIGVVNGGVWKTTDYGRTWTRSSTTNRLDQSGR